MRNFLLNCSLFLSSVVITVLLLEVALRFLPVNTGLGIQEVSDNSPVFHAEPNLKFIYSTDWDFSIVNRGETNAQGFVNNYDYDKDSELPNVAIIGDSYVEALMVPFKETLTGNLLQYYKDQYNVYSFAFSGAPLSQYLAWAQHAKETYSPSKAIIPIIANDFDESLLKYKSAPGFNYFVDPYTKGAALVRIDYDPGLLREIVRSSALARYLIFNIKIQKFFTWSPQNKSDVKTPSYENNVAFSASEERLKDSKKAADTFLNALPDALNLSPSDILFVIDSNRRRIYSPDQKDLPDSYSTEMFSYFIHKAQEQGFNILDTYELFRQDYAKHSQKFEFQTDYHWNGYAHTLIANKVIDLGFIEK